MLNKDKSPLEQEDSKDLLAVQQTLRGDVSAFDDIVHRYTPLLYSLAYRYLGDTEEAEDAVQEIFFKSYKSLGSFKLDTRFFSWFYTVALNWLRSKTRTKKYHKKALLFSQAEHVLQKIPASGGDPITEFAGKEEEKRAQEALAQIKPAYRDPFILHYQEHLSLKEVGDILGLSPEAVKTRLFRARQVLIKMLTS